MDEHPGGMGSHNSSGGPPLGPGSIGGNNNNNGGGGGGLRQQQQPPPLTLQGQEGELQRPQYTIPGILHYIQHEWARFEMERAHWEVEKAELQTFHLVTGHPLMRSQDKMSFVNSDAP